MTVDRYIVSSLLSVVLAAGVTVADLSADLDPIWDQPVSLQHTSE